MSDTAVRTHEIASEEERGAPPDGYEWRWENDPNWEVLHPDFHPQHVGSKCRWPKCPNKAVAAMWRPFWNSARQEPGKVRFCYCADHLYGRRIHGMHVQFLVAREIAS